MSGKGIGLRSSFEKATEGFRTGVPVKELDNKTRKLCLTFNLYMHSFAHDDYKKSAANKMLKVLGDLGMGSYYGVRLRDENTLNKDIKAINRVTSSLLSNTSKENLPSEERVKEVIDSAIRATFLVCSERAHILRSMNLKAMGAESYPKFNIPQEAVNRKVETLNQIIKKIDNKRYGTKSALK